MNETVENLFDLKLFLGFAPDEQFDRELKKANPYFISLFIGKDEYLQVIEQKGKRFMGKLLNFYPSVSQLIDLEKHLLSLLQKLTPNYHFEANPPQLIIYTHSCRASRE